MAGAQIFVMYTDGSGSNVTLSPRLGGGGHVMPTYNSNAQVTLLDGSGVSNGQMTANFKCSSCNSWSGGSMDLTASSFGFIFAAKSGSELNSDSLSETITQHTNTYGTFSFSSSAKGGSDANPFVAGSSSSGSSTSTVTSSNPTATASSGGSRTSACTQGAKGGTQTSNGDSSTTTTGGYGFPFGTSAPSGFFGHSFPTGGFGKRDADDDCDDNELSDLSASYSKQQRILVAHGVLAALAFLILFPFGAISIRLMSFPNLVAFHAVFQGLSYLVYLVAFGMGVWMASQLGYVSSSSVTLVFALIDNSQLTKYHPIIGILLFVLLFLQPIFGIFHHSGYNKYHRRTLWSYGHLWNGRIVITLGMINGGLGLMLANNTKIGVIAYGVIAAVVWLIYVAAIIIGERRKAREIRELPPKYEDAMMLNHIGGPRRSHGSEASQEEYYGPNSYI